MRIRKRTGVGWRFLSEGALGCGACPHPNPPPLTQGRERTPLRNKLPPLRSGGGSGWG
ncbi:protein of unknown function (plasmid) [Azospirillum baldaniorum]|uniref:Uncharacterized protein n=1 Tax=Azospirillum baldaniorum TaxID=1064539 RepID=A0A9P1K0N8_9PROT|nr:protein of unknown function [Azospirillum baldaniorum]